jgi:beta-aspartyl-peptidase (threonine type)
MTDARRAGIAIHGGAGTITRAQLSVEQELTYRSALKDIITKANTLLAKRSGK